MTLVWKDEAVDEYVESAGYYESRENGLGDRFVDCVEIALTRLKRNPEFYRTFERGCRKIRVDPFPYAIVYLLREEHLVVVAIVNQHREPGYWHGRLDG